MNKYDRTVSALRMIDLHIRRFRSRVKTGAVSGEDMENHIKDLNKYLNSVRDLIIQRSKKRQS